MKIIEKTFDALTGQETITERDETEQERAEREAVIAEVAQLKLEAEAKAQAKAALLERLGMTQEEANLLLG
jgi:hypothetical protein